MNARASVSIACLRIWATPTASGLDEIVHAFSVPVVDIVIKFYNQYEEDSIFIPFCQLNDDGSAKGCYEIPWYSSRWL